MSQEFGEVNFWPCHKEKEAKLIGTGIDSNVYRLGDVVIKNYKVISRYGNSSGLRKEFLADYYLVTNLAQRMVEEQKMRLHLPVSKKDVPLEINPFLNLHTCDICGGIEGISKYIPGKNMSNVKTVFDDYELKIALVDLSTEIEDKLGYSGINIIPMNAKMSKEGTFIVTDICADISILRKS